MECKLNEGRLIWLFTPEKKRLRVETITVLKYLKSCYKEEREQLLSFAAEDRTWSNGFKLQQSRNRLGATTWDATSLWRRNISMAT